MFQTRAHHPPVFPRVSSPPEYHFGTVEVGGWVARRIATVARGPVLLVHLPEAHSQHLRFTFGGSISSQLTTIQHRSCWGHCTTEMKHKRVSPKFMGIWFTIDHGVGIAARFLPNTQSWETKNPSESHLNL